MSVLWCSAHNVDWYLREHELDETCDARRLPDFPSPPEAEEPKAPFDMTKHFVRCLLIGYVAGVLAILGLAFAEAVLGK